MKTNFKRLFALLLTLCMLATLMVPVAFAEDVATDAPSANVAETYQIRLKDLTHTDPTTATGLDALAVTTGSQTGTTYKSNLPLGAAAIANAYPDTLNWKFYATSSELVYRADQMWQARLSGWGAIQILVTEPGVYALNMTTDKANTAVEGTTWTNESAAWSGNVVAYIIPLSDVEAAIAAGTVTTEAEDGTVTTTAPTAAEIIPTLMTDKYFVGSDYLAAEDTVVTFDEVRMNAGEYVVVYDASKTAYCISEMSLVGDPYEVTEIANYQIRPVDPDVVTAEEAYNMGGLAKELVTYTEPVVDAETGEVTTAATYVYYAASSGKAMSKMNTATHYKNGVINWKYLEGTANYRPATNYQPRLDVGNKLALQIKVPEAGFFALTLSTANGNTYSAAAYVLNVNDKPADAATYAELATAETSIGSADLTAGAPAIFDTKYYEAGEYIVVLENIHTKNTLPILALGLIQYSGDIVVEGGYTSTQEISYKLYNIDDSVFNQIEGETTTFAAELSDGNGGTTNLQDYVAALYAEGKLDWKIEAYPSTFTGANFVSEKAHDRGIEVKTPNDKDTATDWFAIRFRVKEAGYYSITSQMAMNTTPGITTYLIPAAEETMTADAIQAQILPENGLVYRNMYAKSDKAVSVGYLEGEYIIVYKVPYTKNRTFGVKGILLESEAPLKASDVQNFAFDMFAEGNPYYELLTDRYSATAVTDETTGLVTGYTYTKLDPYAVDAYAQFDSDAGVVTRAKDADGNPTYSITNKTNADTGEVTQTLDEGVGTLWAAAFRANGSGYPDTLNWRPDDTNVTSNSGKWYRAHNLEANTGHFKFENNKTAGTYGSVMLNVEKAGTYKLSIENGQYDTNNVIYFVDDFVTDYAVAHSDTVMASLMIDSNIIGSAEGVSIAANAVAEIGEVTIDAAGDYLVVFRTVGTADVWLKNITLTPVVEEAVAVVAGETYATFAEAAAAAAVECDTITLMDNVINGGDIVVPAGVSLNLMGYSVYADSIDASAPGAQIVDPTDGNAVLVADEVIFNENNPQLPLVDKAAGAYRLFNVDVVSSATTGNASATKYWFKVNFSNADALALIGSSTELRINALMTGTYKEAGTDYAAGDPWSGTATADAAFSCTWAENSNKYIVVYSVGSGLNSFRLSPAVSANGVIISGDAMKKG